MQVLVGSENRHTEQLSIWQRPGSLSLMLAAIAFIAFAGTTAFEFVFDDEVIIVRNAAIQSWHAVPHYFTTVFGSNVAQNIISYYRPLVLLWFRIHHALFGLNPLWYHLTNVLLHTGITALVFSIAMRLTNETRLAFVAALFFALHPAHVENVSWVACASDTLLALFMLGGFLAWLHSLERQSRKWLALSLFLYAAAALSKEPGVLLPALIFAYALIFQSEGRFFSRPRATVRAVMPFLPITFLYIVLRAVATKGLIPHTAVPLSVRTMLLTWPSLLLFYVKNLLWPLHTSAFFDFFPVSVVGLRTFVLPVALLALLVIAIVAWAWRCPEYRRCIAFAVLWILLTIAPALYIRMFAANDFAHPRYLYVPSIGFVILLAIALNLLMRPLGEKPYAVVVVVICIFMFRTTFAQQQYWASNLVLYSHSVNVAPRNPVARVDFANELLARNAVPEAIAQYKRVLADNPDFWLANYNLGSTLVKLKAPKEALPYLDRAVATLPSDSDQYFYRGIAKVQLGQRDEALWDFDRAVTLSPGNVDFRRAAEQLRKTDASLFPGRRQ